MAQQTAVEWLINKIEQDQMYKALSQREWVEVFKQAKQMEKEQIMNSWVHGVAETNDSQKTAEQYYNETYVSNI